MIRGVVPVGQVGRKRGGRLQTGEKRVKTWPNIPHSQRIMGAIAGQSTDGLLYRRSTDATDVRTTVGRRSFNASIDASVDRRSTDGGSKVLQRVDRCIGRPTFDRRWVEGPSTRRSMHRSTDVRPTVGRRSFNASIDASVERCDRPLTGSKVLQRVD